MLCYIKICCPGGHNSELYRNRKGYFSVNVQALCSLDLNLQILLLGDGDLLMIQGYFETAGCVQNWKIMITMVFCWVILGMH